MFHPLAGWHSYTATEPSNPMSDNEHIPDGNRSTDAGSNLIPARMIGEFVYCPRLFYLEHVQNEWADSADTLSGELVHRRVDAEKGDFPPPDSISIETDLEARSVLLSAESLGVIARIDLVEVSDGMVCPVDYKKGSPDRGEAWEPDRVQLCLQGLILRENGYACEEGVVYYAATKQRIVVPFDDTLVKRTLEAIAGARSAATQRVPPPPLVDSPKCPRCSLVGICLPDETSLLKGESLDCIRRLLPARDDASPVYVQEQGARLGKNGDRLVVRCQSGEEISVRLLDVSQVSVFGNVQITARALRSLAERGIPIFHFTYGGWLVAMTVGVGNRNVELRAKQYQASADSQRSLEFARAFVVGKLKNQRTILRRNHPGPVDAALAELRRLVQLARAATSIERLLGLEGMAARTYFSFYAQLLREAMGFEEAGRTRRPPTDPVNAMLSFLYSLLVKDAAYALLAVGLDPHQGLYHKLRYGRPSLALDLAEEFRPLVVDSVVLRLINSRAVTASDFIQRGAACALREGARRRVIKAYEARLSTLVTHPVFGYRISYRRVLEVQARLLARAIEGDIQTYLPFVTR